MKTIHYIRSEEMSNIELHQTIGNFESLGWIYIGISDSPPPHLWLTFIWEDDSNPIYPEGCIPPTRWTL